MFYKTQLSDKMIKIQDIFHMGNIEKPDILRTMRINLLLGQANSVECIKLRRNDK